MTTWTAVQVFMRADEKRAGRAGDVEEQEDADRLEAAAWWTFRTERKLCSDNR
jgi:hypothetical protein